ncbi:MAG TPA: reverse transcriptase/maturase family protein [Candidatus Brocadiia bacterium]|nr:reverse transcriptase/maturase family protein [Candidatus Brocadiia bacterium]
MKTYKRLFDRVCSFGNLHTAYRRARRGKRDKAEVIGFDFDQEKEIIRLESELSDGSYRPGEYRSFYIYEPKRRVISAAPFRDRVVHHAICNVIEPIFEERFIFDSYACRKNKGSHKALDRYTRYSRQFSHVLKADIVQYFPSVDHDALMALLEKRITDRSLMDLMAMIVSGGKDVFRDEYRMVYFPGDDLFAALRPRGLPIGNLTSQFFANIYLDPLDHFVKEELRIPAYIRYCDDFVVFGNDRSSLEDVRNAIDGFLRDFRLVLHPRKSVIFRVKDGVPFLGFLIFPDHRLLLHRSVTRAGRRLRETAEEYADGLISEEDVRQRVMAWLGHVSHGDTWKLRKKLLSGCVFRSGGNDAGDTDIRKDVRLEPVDFPEDGRFSEPVPAFSD